MTVPEEPFHVRLFKLLSRRLTDDELRTLCFCLPADYDNLAGDTKSAKLRELIEQHRRKRRLEVLCHWAAKLFDGLEGEIRELGGRLHGAGTYLDIATTEWLPPPGIEHVLRNPERMYRPLECSEVPEAAGEDALRYIDGRLDGRKALLIVGDYGTGKSFLVQRLFLDQARAYREQGGRLPVLLPLRQLHGMAEDLVLTKIAEQLRLFRYFDSTGLSAADERAEVERGLRTGELLCILDGFDEIPLLAIRYDPLEELRKLLRCLAVGENKVVITTRPGIVPAVLTPVFERLVPELGLGYLLPWKPERDWPRYLHQCRECGIAAEADFEQQVLRQKELRELTVTPLYCQMLVESREAVVEAQDLNVAQLYSIYTDRYFTNVRERSLLRDLFPEPAEEIRYKHACLEATAVGMLHQRSLRLTDRQIEHSLSSMNAHRYDMHQLRAFVRSETLIFSLLVIDASSTYSFSHKSFYEYYVARKLREELELVTERQSLLNRILMPREVIAFLAGLLSEEDPFSAKLAAMFADRDREPLAVLGLPRTRRLLLRNLALLQLERTGGLEAQRLDKLDFTGYQFAAKGRPVGLRRVTLDNCVLEGASLLGADLRDSSLVGANLNRCVLDGADLRGVNLRGAFLNEIMCAGTRFSGAELGANRLTEGDADGIRSAIFAERRDHPDQVDKEWLADTLRKLERDAM
jgi:hypothetical protein